MGSPAPQFPRFDFPPVAPGLPAAVPAVVPAAHPLMPMGRSEDSKEETELEEKNEKKAVP